MSDAIVLDIGAGVGALVLNTSSDLVGAEIEVSPDREGAPRTHTRIRRRHLGDREVFAGVYPGLPAGRWRVFGVDERPFTTVVIRSGEVAVVDGGDCRSPQ